MKKRSIRKPAVFLDRDGTIIHDAGYLSRLSQIKLYSRAAEALRLLRQAGFLLFVVSNQSGVARGYFPESSVKKTNQKIQSLLKSRDAGIDGYFYCPHFPGGKVKSFSKVCPCRKPKPGMVKEAARLYPIDLKRSYMVGDKIDDLLLAQKAGLAEGILVRTGNGRKSEKQVVARGLRKTRVAPHLLKAAQWIMASKDTK